MTENERIRVIRMSSDACKTLDLFGKRLGVSASAISQIENGKVSLTSKMRTSICKEFGVNEEWLRTGEGEMMVPIDQEEEILGFVKDLLADEPDFRRALVRVLARMTTDEWAMLTAKARELLGHIETPPSQ